MIDQIREAKLKLTLPSLMQRLGLGEHARKSARCPFHDDKHNSFSVWKNGAGLWFFKCHAGCGEGDEIKFVELFKRISQTDAIKLYVEMAGIASPNETQIQAQKPNRGHVEPIDWLACLDAFTDKHVEWLAKWRGYSVEFCFRLRENRLVGLYNDGIAFPVHDRAGSVAAIHYRLKDSSWRYNPQGAKVRPLIIGTLTAGGHVHIFESQWDAFALMDKLGDEAESMIITRGAANGALVSGLIPAGTAYVFAWKQNDAEKNGRRAGDEWLKNVVAHAGVPVKCVLTPPSFKDPNDWTKKGGASLDDLIQSLVAAKPVIPNNAEVPRAGNSLNSQFLSFAWREGYPEPLKPEAFHGLAGEIVHRIAPHTEADPAAMLFQLLAAFGNVIGHNAFIVADGARHYLHIYGVLVGESAKGRKGTSWSQIGRLFALIDEGWRKDRVASGLSSGEGLIWAVHDAIEERKPVKNKGRFTGEYEIVITDHGVSDKRLFVIEGEFANVLKVMTREGNTLSPVIRAAWDSGNLRTLVKNSPAKATDAHISIIGHITREELRLLLTQTESANGFANRFHWLAVKRSKCLPEGGAIESLNFDDLLDRLEAAVEFALDAEAITRDEEARGLWRKAYPDLSEGKPGLLGAVTGRAEAQVMRLSALYALLDKSPVIRPQHHHAAMALWKYCEESCRWIFGTSTGDRNADKILAALRHAQAGMTKTEISVEVFNRHASSAEIDEALRLLHGLRMVGYQTEATGGAPLQRWFYSAGTGEKSE